MGTRHPASAESCRDESGILLALPRVVPIDPAAPTTPTDSLAARVHVETHASALSWTAVCGGGLVIIALSLILLPLGAGFELSTVSPWSGTAPMRTLGAVTIVWLVTMQVVAGAIGGYVAGRLRGRWTRIHRDEVYFRDTAHGFLAWALAIVVTGAFLASAGARLVGASDSAANRDGEDPLGTAYYTDMLFRSNRPIPATDDAAQRAETRRILSHVLASSETLTTDTAYLARIVSERTGLAAAEAANRVSDVLQQARQFAEVVRKATTRILLWIFVALLCGAFSASVAATIGGRQRDMVTMI